MTDQTLKDVSQRNPADPNPNSDDVFGRMFRRGPTVAADGGERGARTKRDADARDGTDDAADVRPVAEQTLKDVDQTPPHEDSNSNRVWERGGEQGVGDEAAGEQGAEGERGDEDGRVDASERVTEDADEDATDE